MKSQIAIESVDMSVRVIRHVQVTNEKLFLDSLLGAGYSAIKLTGDLYTMIPVEQLHGCRVTVYKN